MNIIIPFQTQSIKYFHFRKQTIFRFPILHVNRYFMGWGRTLKSLCDKSEYFLFPTKYAKKWVFFTWTFIHKWGRKREIILLRPGIIFTASTRSWINISRDKVSREILVIKSEFVQLSECERFYEYFTDEWFNIASPERMLLNELSRKLWEMSLELNVERILEDQRPCTLIIEFVRSNA